MVAHLLTQLILAIALHTTTNTHKTTHHHHHHQHTHQKTDNRRPTQRATTLKLLAQQTPDDVRATTATQPPITPQPVGGPIEALVDAVQASRCGAINQNLLDANDKENVLALVDKNAKLMNTVNIATALHRLALIEKKRRAERDALLRDARFEALVSLVEANAAEMSPRAIADVLWSCATLRNWPPQLLKPVLTTVAKHLQEAKFEPHHLSIVTWSLATLECKPVVLLQQIELQAVQSETLAMLNPQNCANLLWGFARLRQQTTMLPAISRHLDDHELFERCKPVEVADLCYAAGMLGAHADGAVDEMAPAFVGRLTERMQPGAELLEQFSSRQMVTVLWAYARLRISPPVEVLDAWREHILEKTARFPLQAADRENLRRSLTSLGQNATAWIDPNWSPQQAEQSAPPAVA